MIKKQLDKLMAATLHRRGDDRGLPVWLCNRSNPAITYQDGFFGLSFEAVFFSSSCSIKI